MIKQSTKIALATEALTASAKLRKKYGYDSFSPISMFDFCEKAGVPARFVDIDMEGMYVNLGEGLKPTIFISAFRPFHRKVYTCAHEFGHHHFGHGMTVEKITTTTEGYNEDEFLVDTFASYLLMPPMGLKGAFNKRKIELAKITPLDCLAVASYFGVGYSTLINQLNFNSYINDTHATTLLKNQPKNIKQNILGDKFSNTLFVVDENFKNTPIDVETNSLLLLPEDVMIEDGSYMNAVKTVSGGIVYEVVKPGISRLHSEQRDWSAFVRIQKFEYAGLTKFRHLAD